MLNGLHLFTIQKPSSNILPSLNITIPLHSTSFSRKNYYITVKFCIIDFLEFIKKTTI